MENENVSRAAFQRFVDVRDSGRVNMLSSAVQTLACINKEQHRYIIGHFNELSKLYGIS